MSKLDLDPWIADLASTDLAKRRAAARELGQREDIGPATIALVNAIDDPDETVAEWANEALENLGQPPRKMLKGLGELLKPERPNVAYWAATLIGRLGKDGSAALDQLQLFLRSSPPPASRDRAQWAIQQIKAKA